MIKVINSFLISGFLLSLFTGCNHQVPEQKQKETPLSRKGFDCLSSKKIYMEPMFTNINLKSNNLILESYEIVSDTIKKIARKKIKIYTDYDDKLYLWRFNIYDSLDVRLCYKFLFYTSDDTISYFIKDLKIGEDAVFANGKYNKYCKLIEYNINGKVVNGSNLNFE